MNLLVAASGRTGRTFRWSEPALDAGGSVLLGAWLMFTRVTLGTEGSMANADHLIGSLAITVSVIACAEVARTARYLNAVLGACLLATPFTSTRSMRRCLHPCSSGWL